MDILIARKPKAKKQTVTDKRAKFGAKPILNNPIKKIKKPESSR
jgi:hypothetical protein